MTPLEIYNKHFKDWNESIFPASFHFEKAMIEYCDQQCLERDERIKKLEEALTELVECKNLNADSQSYMKTDHYYAYLRRFETAWQQARKILKP